MINVSRLVEVPLKSGFPGEALHFTPWLAEPENLSYFGNRIGLGDLTWIGTEVPVTGGRALDLLAEDGTGRRVAIENQYGVADHDHLTRGLAYAVALEAAALVVVAEDHRPEFVAVADYLNRVAEHAEEDGIAVFLVRARLVQAGEGLYADFDQLSGPNAWRSETAAAVSEAEAAQNTKKAELWHRLFPELHKRGLFKSANIPKKVPFLQTTAVSGSKTYFQVVVNQSHAYCKLELREEKQQNEAMFDSLLAKRAEIEASFGGPLKWDRADAAIGSFVTSSGIDAGFGTSASDDDLVALAEQFKAFTQAIEGPLQSVLGG